jgi:PilZ domain
MRLKKTTERRNKMRFPMNREVRYKLLEDERIMAVGLGTTTDMSSGGVAFHSDVDLPMGSYIELSISWPVLLDNTCPMRLIVFGRVLRGSGTKVCSVEKWEFRTQSRQVATSMPLRVDGKLRRWAEYRKEVIMRTATAAVAAAAAASA